MNENTSLVLNRAKKR